MISINPLSLHLFGNLACQAVLCVGCVLFSHALFAAWEGQVGVEGRFYFEDPLDAKQHTNENLSFYVQPEYRHRWNGGKSSFTFVGFGRLDQNDEERSHVDIRELSWDTSYDNWDVRIGLRKVFWGVTEFQHLVDIINQTDLVDNIDTEDKLGQPMINVAAVQDWGTVDFFVMPYFRERNYAGVKGRLRNQPFVSDSEVRYESDDEEKHVDYALRYSHYFGDWDVGLSYFKGTDRSPDLIDDVDANNQPISVAYYELIDQIGVDLQVTKEHVLWKFEGIYRDSAAESYTAAGGGFEYTLPDNGSSTMDVSLLSEYHADSRGENSRTFDQDIGFGVRFGLHDAKSTAILMGFVYDLNNNGHIFSIESSQRIADNWTLVFDARFFEGQRVGDSGYDVSQDDHIEITLSHYF